MFNINNNSWRGYDSTVERYKLNSKLISCIVYRISDNNMAIKHMKLWLSCIWANINININTMMYIIDLTVRVVLHIQHHFYYGYSKQKHLKISLKMEQIKKHNWELSICSIIIYCPELVYYAQFALVIYYLPLWIWLELNWIELNWA